MVQVSLTTSGVVPGTSSGNWFSDHVTQGISLKRWLKNVEICHTVSDPQLMLLCFYHFVSQLISSKEFSFDVGFIPVS